MGEIHQFQPLTVKDRVTVVLYRLGIALSAVIIAIAAYVLLSPMRYQESIALRFNVFLVVLYVAVGLSVFFIHLYVSAYHRLLKRLYYIALASLVGLFVLGRGDVLSVVADKHYGAILLIPLSGCLGFITAKEAFCFKLTEGYLIAFSMPLYLVFIATGGMSLKGASYGLVLIALMLVIFTLRKVFMPIHYDIGDKSAYR
jgi:uncharacterized integral membrane protein